MASLPLIGITMGDPSGIGAEIICKALQDLPPAQRSRTAVIGNLFYLDRANKLIGGDLKFGASTAEYDDGAVPV
ncbi:MAG: 4-hydroxythreonine-4-phosphate dehydrogenase PdxA, partial [Pseudomonadota bacterium]|nr:4-hydroxythreonine-4-phosphate dehydrogenase PdxA [Pseudomonadota bacterium]